MLVDVSRADGATQHLLKQKIASEYDSLQRIVRMDPTEFDHLVDRLLPELTDLLR